MVKIRPIKEISQKYSNSLYSQGYIDSCIEAYFRREQNLKWLLKKLNHLTYKELEPSFIKFQEKFGNSEKWEEFAKSLERKKLINEEELWKLTPRQQKIFQLYFGLSGERKHTFQEIGKLIGVSRERIRQIIENCQRKLTKY